MISDLELAEFAVVQIDSISLRYATPKKWVETVLLDFDSFLIDHAACERKASAAGINFVVKYHDRPQLIDAMIRFSREELYHFHQVSKWVLKRGIRLGRDEKDPYVNALQKQIRNGRDEELLDRLLVCGITEARGHERFGLVAKYIEDEELKIFYSKLTESEFGHQTLFLKLAYQIFDIERVNERLDQLLNFEAELVQSLPFRGAVH